MLISYHIQRYISNWLAWNKNSSQKVARNEDISNNVTPCEHGNWHTWEQSSINLLVKHQSIISWNVYPFQLVLTQICSENFISLNLYCPSILGLIRGSFISLHALYCKINTNKVILKIIRPLNFSALGNRATNKDCYIVFPQISHKAVFKYFIAIFFINFKTMLNICGIYLKNTHQPIKI